MKVDTKKMTPMSKVAPDTMKDSPDRCLFNENKYIQDGASPLKEHNNEEDQGGFWIRFIPTIFYTPVKCSKRNSADERTLDAKGVEDLNDAFSKLLIGDKKDNDKKEETKDDEDATEGDQNAERETTEENKEKLGRFKTTAKSVKTSKKVDVMRSYRLVDEEEE